MKGQKMLGGIQKRHFVRHRQNQKC